MRGATPTIHTAGIVKLRKGRLGDTWHLDELFVNLQEYSDTLLIFLLKGLRPEKYRERFEHSGTGPGGAIRVTYDASMNPPE